MQEQKSEKHLAALAYAAAGIPVFPCMVNAKHPATENGFHAATTDIGQINTWWAAADYNIAFCPHEVGWGIVDLDGPEAEAAWAAISTAETYEVSTPRGGRHLYFEGEMPMSAWAPGRKRCLGEHIDTRGVGSYALLPPSVFEGKPYVLLHDRPLLPIPPFILEKLRATDIAVQAASDDLDTPAAIARATSLLSDLVGRGDVAITGRGGNNRTYQLACELRNLGLSHSGTFALLTEHWNPHCLPPWDSAELDTIVQNASSYAQNEPGAWAVTTAVETFGSTLDSLVSEPPPRSRFHAEDETEQEEGKDPTWLVSELMPERSTCLMVGQTGSYKSFLALDLALSISAGVGTFGTTTRQALTFYAAAEGRASLKRGRRRAWKMGRGISDPLANFFVMPAPMIASPADVQEFGDEVKRVCAGRSPSLIVLDTVTKCMAGLDENNPGDVGRFVAFCDSLVRAFGCSVLAIHHQSDKPGAAEIRGSSAFAANFDTVLMCKANRAMKEVEVRVRKHKDAEEREKPWVFEGKQIGPSLVFSPVDRRLAQPEQEFDPRKVGAALQALKAFGPEAAVTTAILAGALTPTTENEPEAARADAKTRTARALGGLAREKLKAYCEHTSTGLKWALPSQPSKS